MLVADARFRFQLRNCNFEFRGIVSHISSTFSGRCAGDIFGVPEMGRILQKKHILGSQKWARFWARNGPILGSRNGPLLANFKLGVPFLDPKIGPFLAPKMGPFLAPKMCPFLGPQNLFFAELYRCLGPHITFPGPKPCLQSRAFHIFLPRTLFSEGLRLCWFVCRGGDIGMPYHALSLCCQRCITPNMDV
jgi:hypothetical protein